MVIKLNSCCAHCRAGVVGEEHNAGRSRKVSGEIVTEPKSIAFRPSTLSVIGSPHEVQTVDCDDA